MRARRSLPATGSMTGPIWLVGSEGQPTLIDEVASTSCLRKRRERATEPTRMQSEAAEHFWPAWPKAEATMSFTARSRSALGVTTIAFLPLVSPSSARSGRNERKSAAVSKAPVSTNRSTRGSATKLRPRSPSSTCTSANASVGTPASQSAWTIIEPVRRAWVAGLTAALEPAARAARIDPAGIATGKFHGGATTVSLTGTWRAPSIWSSSSAKVA